MTAPAGQPVPAACPAGSPAEVFRVFLRLGLTSFGGPVAHLGYFRAELVERRRWLDEAAFADIVALCQFLPGPASSQTGISLGILRAGLPGAIAAWLGFTMPSAIALMLFGYGVTRFGNLTGAPWLHGLKIVAVAVVAQAVWGMARNLCPDRERASIAVGAAVLMLWVPTAAGQVGAIAAGGLIGWLLFRHHAPVQPGPPLAVHLPRSWSIAAAVIFFALLFGLPGLAAAYPVQPLKLFYSFYRSGALVFGGGHVVLPLLRQAVVTPGWVGDNAFLAGYGAAQAIPGPLFTFAAYLGAVVRPLPHGVAGAALALAAIFLPGLLVLVGTLPFWHGFRRRAGAQAAMRGINAAVVGLLGAAL
ncbi:MAG TPA: chromate efflux transporter, partial [Stellaceae bacterium]|nr:chromate efflux transporter [Stellaceae bacterium]